MHTEAAHSIQTVLISSIISRIAGICARGGYEYAVSVYHYAMTLAHSAQAETQQYHRDNVQADNSFDQASWHMQQLEVRAVAEVQLTVASCISPAGS